MLRYEENIDISNQIHAPKVEKCICLFFLKILFTIKNSLHIF